MLDRFQTRVFHSVLISDLVGGFSSYAHYLALTWLKAHVPFLGPRREVIDILLELFTILDVRDWPVTDTVVCK